MKADLPVAAAVLLVMMACHASAAGAGRSRDEWEIRRLQARQQDAWNRHDATAYAALFADDGEVVNVVGWRWKRRREIERQLAAAYAVVFRESRLTIGEVDVRFLARDIAVAHVRWTMEGARTPPSIPDPRQGIQTQVLQKRGGAWRIAAFQNTSSVPEAPFPTEGSAPRGMNSVLLPESPGAPVSGRPASADFGCMGRGEPEGELRVRSSG